MQNKFYLVPIKDELVFFNGFNLFELYKKAFKPLYNLENNLNEKINDKCDEEYISLLNGIDTLYSHFNIPMYLIVEEIDGVKYEYVTKTVVTSIVDSYFEVHSVPYEIVADYFYAFNYKHKIANLISYMIDPSDIEMKRVKKQ